MNMIFRALQHDWREILVVVVVTAAAKQKKAVAIEQIECACGVGGHGGGGGGGGGGGRATSTSGPFSNLARTNIFAALPDVRKRVRQEEERGVGIPIRSDEGGERKAGERDNEREREREREKEREAGRQGDPTT